MFGGDKGGPGGGGGGRIYIGSLPGEYTEKDVEREFEKFGKIVKLEFKRTVSGAGYCFLEYADPRDARDAIAQLHGRPPPGFRDAAPLRVEIPLARSGRTDGFSDDAMPRGLAGRRGRFVLEVRGLPPSGSWQDLKDHFRGIGDVGFAEVRKDPDAPDSVMGKVSFFSKRDMMEAIEALDGSTFRSHEGEKSRITVREKRTVGGRGGRSDDAYDAAAYDADPRVGGRGAKYGSLYESSNGGYSSGGTDAYRASVDVVHESAGRGRAGGPGTGGYYGYHPAGSPSPCRGAHPAYTEHRRGRSRSRDRVPPARGGGYGADGPPSGYYDGVGTSPRCPRLSLERGSRRYDDWADRRR
ncbi:Function: human SRp75 can complement a splicing-deficient extract, related [Neospora caninum Liverpool]|uniref:Function: human SRp75 can complement a splicing-deficient extract, related n=1 Tax=Neospora caninum (strain Liverpool) TaxID=572307 RepID=F0VQ08_NEOCL|nr:Function: human SRp75 can complement a splicing-deficient extract, related [Neospora caninum Liverpool]CBZ55805.1 Function: human SRp75 can complement a splicing-deficient extract, related [Neospora caninum Liverpool]CEL70547.1 TPA: Function: human SRp75 can complement a splicing-deficient extract, related [Neospora caninum Liverpool]|eukprot:XP_003885831.1 Function: human SRp75 can complement a splicing-deficient extract, related [Neospora caninum Liverpool]